MWDQRYSRTEYVLGTDPAEFLTRHADLLSAGSDALVVADGGGPELGVPGGVRVAPHRDGCVGGGRREGPPVGG